MEKILRFIILFFGMFAAFVAADSQRIIECVAIMALMIVCIGFIADEGNKKRGRKDDMEK